MLSRVILNRVTLSKALLNRYNKNVSNQAKKYTVDDLIQLGYLTAYGNENEGYRIDTAQPLPMPIKDIKDFDAVFIGRSVPASVDTQRACMFNLSNTSHLTESQQKEIISKYNNKPNDRAISQLLFRNYTLPNADLKIIQNKTTEDSWQYSHKMFEGSTFNNVELNIKGSISSTNKLFMGLKCDELEIYTNSTSGNNVVAGTDIIAPHDTTEMYASSAINKYPRGVSYYRGLSNWTFTNNWNGKATEIPNVRGVETEEERITSPINMMKLPSGILYQTLWISSITRIGPVLDVTNVTGSEYLWGNCGIQLPNVTDIRIKGLNNLDWDFRGGATDKAFIPKMDEDSIIYCLNNVVEQTDTTRNIYFSTEVIKPTYEENSAKVKVALSNASTKGWNVYCGDTALIIPDTPPVGKYIQFEDAEVERVLMSKGVSSDGVGITMEDAEKVTDIGTTWFYQNTEIVSFDELKYFTGVTAIKAKASTGKGSFEGCTSLTSIAFPSSLTSVGQRAFFGCSALSNVENIEVLKTISLNAFYNCTSLAFDELNLPNLTSLGQNAFYGVKIKKLNLGALTTLPNASSATQNLGSKSILEEIVLSEGLISIPPYSFYNYSKLNKINLENVEKLGGYDFGGSLDSVEVRMPKLASIGGNQAFYKSGVTLLDFTGGTFTATKDSFAEQASKLHTIIMPDTLTSIGWSAFKSCKVLQTVIMLASTPPALQSDSFGNTNSTFIIYVPDASLEAYKTAVNWSAYADRIHPLSEIEGSNGVTLYDRLYGDGSAYIETDYFLKGNERIESVAMNSYVDRSNKPLWGAYDGTRKTEMLTGGDSQSNQIQWVIYYGSSSYVASTYLSTNNRPKVLYALTPSQFGFDGLYSPHSGSSIGINAPFCIFADYAEREYKWKGWIGSVIITDTDTSEVLAKFTPASYNGEAGMYDEISGKFYGNAAASGAFYVENE